MSACQLRHCLPWTTLGLVLLVAILMADAVLLPTEVAWDPSYGMLAAMQHEAGVSPDIYTLTSADPEDLAEDAPRRVSWWAPSYQAVPYAFRALGMSWGNALRATILASLLLGGVGWAGYFRQLVPDWNTVRLLLLVMFSASYSMGFVAQYGGGDLLLWATTPYLLSINLLAMKSQRPAVSMPLAFCGGLAAISIYFVKYSGVFLGIGLGLAWTWVALQRPSRRRCYGGWLLGAVVAAAWLLMARSAGGTTPASSAGRSFLPFQGLAVLGLWPTAMTDVAACLTTALGRRGFSAREISWVTASLGWLLMVGLLGLAWSQRRSLRDAAARGPMAAWFEIVGAPAVVVCAVVAADTVLYAGLVSLGAAVSLEARLARLSGLLAMPLVFTFLLHCCRHAGRTARSCAVAWLFLLFVLPPGFGMLRLLKQTVQVVPRREQLVTREGMGAWFGPTVNAQAFYDEVRSRLPSKQTVLYTKSPTFFFFCPDQRCLIVEADSLYSREQLRSMVYKGVPADGVALLLPVSLVSEGKLEAIQASFHDIRRWESLPLRTAPGWSLSLGKAP